jgi:hypothetical protein
VALELLGTILGQQTFTNGQMSLKLLCGILVFLSQTVLLGDVF